MKETAFETRTAFEDKIYDQVQKTQMASSLTTYLYVLAIMLFAFVATNIVLRNPVHAFGIEPVAAAIGSGVLAYYYVHVYMNVETAAVRIDKPVATVSSPPTNNNNNNKDAITSTDGYEKVQTGLFPSEPKS